MWTRRNGLTVALVMLVVVTATARPATAGGRGDPIMGDFNGDGLTDIAYLGTVQPGRCSAIVQYAQPEGGYGAPIAHIYLRPGGDVIGVCPDIGTAFDRDLIPGDELWIGWGNGRPLTLDYNRLVLDPPSFRVIDTFYSPIIPQFLGTADFVGDGRPTPYSYGRGGFASYLSTATGGDALGPVGWCSVLAPVSVTLKDFTRNGAMDVVLAYSQGCTDNANGVVVVLDDGAMRQLELDPTRQHAWTARVVYANSDRYPDVRTQDTVTRAVSHFINIGGSFVRAPYAEPDAVYPTTPDKILVDVMGNDFATTAARVTIVTPPRYGTLQVLSDRRIAYTPTVSPSRTDRFAYRLTEDGRQSTTSVYVRYPA